MGGFYGLSGGGGRRSGGESEGMEGEGRRAGAGGGPGDVRRAGARAERLRGSAANTRGGGGAYLGDGGGEAGCSLHFCMRRCFSGGEASTGTFRSSHSTFNSLATEPNPAADSSAKAPRDPQHPASSNNIRLHNQIFHLSARVGDNSPSYRF